MTTSALHVLGNDLVDVLCLLFWVFKQCGCLVVNQHFGMACQSHHQGLNDPQDWMTGAYGDLLICQWVAH
jgi:hypothetical protein